MMHSIPSLIGFSQHHGEWFAEGISLSALASQYGTPLYVYSKHAICSAYRAYDVACIRANGSRRARIHYAVKANSNLAVLDELKQLGAGFDLVSGGWFNGLSAVIHAAFLGVIFYYNPLLNSTEDGSITEEQRIVLSQYLSTAAEKEEKRMESEVENVVSGGEVGGRSKGSEGNMGSSSSKPSNSRYTVAGPKDNVDPHVSKQVALKDAENFGMVGLLSSTGGDPDSPTSPWGRDDSLGNDAVSFNGSLWGDQPGDNFGSNGLGLSGVGEGSGGPGEGIGVGPNLGGLGNNIHHGFGPPGVLSKK